jgi:hypothetical protein
MKTPALNWRTHAPAEEKDIMRVEKEGLTEMLLPPWV